jgi:hypothetical protein
MPRGWPGLSPAGLMPGLTQHENERVVPCCWLRLPRIPQVRINFVKLLRLCLTDISGAMGLFEKLDVGPLHPGDYLGWIFIDFFYHDCIYYISVG